MSWRDTARRVRQRSASDGLEEAERETLTAPADAMPELDYDARDEREAIAIYDGGVPESWAVALAAIQYGPRPIGLTEREWSKLLEVVWQRAEAFAATFAAHGWSFEEVFGVGEHWLRLDRLGGAWLAPDARIVAIDERRIVYERGPGRHRTTHTKPARPH